MQVCWQLCYVSINVSYFKRGICFKFVTKQLHHQLWMSLLFEVRDVVNVKWEKHFVFFSKHFIICSWTCVNHGNQQSSHQPAILLLQEWGRGAWTGMQYQWKAGNQRKIPVWQASPRVDGPFCLKPNRPPAFPLWVLCRPLPVSGKLPAWSLFHQQPQEMSLTVRWSLIKNKWMGCSQGLYEWRVGKLTSVPCSERRAKREDKKGKTKH